MRYLESDTDDIERFFDLRMLSAMNQLFTEPNTQTTECHTPEKKKIQPRYTFNLK